MNPETPRCATHGEPPAEAPAESAQEDAGQDPWDEATARAVAEALRAEGFEAGEVLGRGGFGVVLAGERVPDGRAVAIKVGLIEGDKARDEMQHEAEAMGRAAGAHVPVLRWTGEAASRPCIVLDRVRAPTLAQLLESQSGKPMDLAHCRTIVFGLLDAVEAVHAAGLVHLDLKPENVFIHDDGHVSLIDFGLARPADHVRPPREGVQAEPVGTAEYMSPEQCDDVPDLDVRSDVYSSAVLVYEILGGAPPFWGKPADVREAQRSQRVKPLPRRHGLPPAVDVAVRRALSKDRARRFSSVAELQSALRKALATTQTVTQPAKPSAGDNRAKPGRSRRTGRKDKQKLGLLSFGSDASIADLSPVLSRGGGEIAQREGEQFTVVFGHDVSDNPAKPALSVGHHLTSMGLTERALVDVATLTVQSRPDGSRRYFGAALRKRDRRPGSDDPAGVTLTQAAVDVLSDLEFRRLPGAVDRFVIGRPEESEDSSTLFGVRSTPMIGRDTVAAQLIEGVRHALHERAPTLFSVRAQPGLGRTHLAGTVSERVERSFPEAAVVRLMAQQALLGSQSRVLPDLLRRLLDLPERIEPELARSSFVGRLGTVGEQVWPAAAFALGYVPASHPEVERLAAAPGALRAATARALGEALRIRARRGPLCVFLDDAHLADDAVLDALEFATLREVDAPIFACVFVPDDFPEQHSGFAGRARCSADVRLEPLNKEDAGTLARLLLHPVQHVPTGVLDKLVERTQGIPRLLVELVRGLKREGVVKKTEMGTRHYIATDELERVPDLPVVQWNARREVEALPPQLAGHARLASVLGSDFTLEELEALVAMLEHHGAAEEDTELDPAVGVERLVAADILHRHRNGQLSFRYPLLRETIYGMVAEERLRTVHAAALEAYEQALDMGEDERTPRIAMHAARCGQRAKAVEAYLALGKSLRDAQAYIPAEAAFGGAVDNLEEGDLEALITAAHGRGMMRFRLGNNDDAIVDLQLAREKAHLLGDPVLEADIMLDEATVLDWRYKIVESAELVRRAEALVTHPSPRLSARIAGNMTRVHHRAGEAEQCVRVGIRAADQAAALGESGYETRIIALLLVAPDCAKLGRLDEARGYFETLIEEAEAHADLHHVAAALVNRAFLWFSLKDAARLVEDLSRAARIAYEVGEPFLEYCSLVNLAETLYYVAPSPPADAKGRSERTESGDYSLERAEEVAERSLALVEQLWEGSAEGVRQQLAIARIALHAGKLERARELVTAIHDALHAEDSKIGEDPRWTAAEKNLLAAVTLATRAECDEDTWAALHTRAREDELEPQEALEMLEIHARTLLREGQLERGRAAYARAREQASTHDDLMSDRVLRNAARELGPAAAPLSESG